MNWKLSKKTYKRHHDLYNRFPLILRIGNRFYLEKPSFFGSTAEYSAREDCDA